MSNLVEIVDRQNSIIQLQSETINELFQLLAQHITVEELDTLPCSKMMRLVEQRTKEIERMR